jgi:Ca2+-binding EF-hand superfamily protein
MDMNGDGQLSIAEFKKGLTDLELDLTRSEITEIVNHFDKSGDGHLDYNDFLTLVGFKASKTRFFEDEKDYREDDTLDIVDNLRSQIKRSFGNKQLTARHMKEVFTEIDVDNSNYIDTQELIEAMRCLNFKLAFDDAKKLIRKYGRKSANRLNYDEFLDLMGFRSV